MKLWIPQAVPVAIMSPAERAALKRHQDEWVVKDNNCFSTLMMKALINNPKTKRMIEAGNFSPAFSFLGVDPRQIVKILFPPKSPRNENYPRHNNKKCIQNRIWKCGSDPKQERRRGKGKYDNADLTLSRAEKNPYSGRFSK
jgi:hypothetical protein